jgi:YHS domain-containing protein
MTAHGQILDPVCDMIVTISEARDQGLTIERPEREYAFCAHSCLVKFAKTPQAFVPKVEAWIATQAQGDHRTTHHPAGEALAIDEGVRAWYKSCRCCLSEAHPDVVERLDAEKASAS